MTNPNNDHSDYRWLMPLVLRRPDLAERLLQAHRRLTQLPRPWRTRLMWRLGLSMSSATLMLLLASTALNLPVRAEPAAPEYTISVEDGQVAIAQDGQCSLIEAIVNANDTKNGQRHADCASGNPTGADTIVLPTDGMFTLTEVENSGEFGGNGLPWITSIVSIEGNNSTIRRAPSASKFRLFAVGKKGTLNLDRVTLTGGDVIWYYDSDSWKHGSAILSRNEVTISNSRVTDNIGTAVFLVGDCNDSGKLKMDHTAITNNSGAGIVGLSFCQDEYGPDYSHHIVVNNSEISVNGSSGIDLSSSRALIERTTIAGNGGSGIWAYHVILTLRNSTVSGNMGSGVSTLDSYRITISSSTITANQSSGLNINDCTINIYNNLISGNQCRDEQFCDAAEVMLYYSQGEVYENLIGHSGLTEEQAIYSDLTLSGNIHATIDGGQPTPLNQILDTTLRNNGGPTLTHALVSGSPAINRLLNLLCTEVFDQRGSPYWRHWAENGSNSSRECDIGAFEMQMKPEISGISPASGPVGTEVEIKGTNFAGVADVSFNGIAAASFTAHSGKRITAVVPAGARTGKISMATAAGTVTSATDFTITASKPTITDFAPMSGRVGSIVTIIGSNLAETTAVRFNGIAATYTEISSTQVNAVVPPEATTGKVSISTSAGTATSTADFAVLGEPARHMMFIPSISR